MLLNGRRLRWGSTTAVAAATIATAVAVATAATAALRVAFVRTSALPLLALFAYLREQGVEVRL